jgi:prepilin-type N-terminal cleavage/methylation domain-containing protein
MSMECAPRLVIKSSRGFTLIEVLVSLIIGILIVGGVMGVISVSLQFTQRVERKSLTQPVLQAAAQEIFLHPEKAKEGSLTLPGLPDKPAVEIQIRSVQGSDGEDISSRAGQLYRVELMYEDSSLEFSLIIPETDFE